MARGTGNGIQLAVGEKKGELTIVGKSEVGWRWYAECSCGNIRKDIAAWDWRNDPNAFNRCSDCNSPQELVVGATYGLATIIGVIFDKNGRRKYECVCQCGNKIRPKSGSVLVDNGSGCRSCRAKNRVKDQKASMINRVLGKYRNSANKRGKIFNLSPEDVSSIIFTRCFYCNSESSMVDSKTNISYNGIDRVDSSIGYEVENCRPCCTDCNFAKNSMSEENFYLWVERIFNNLKDRGLVK